MKILSLLDGDTIDTKKIANLKNTKIFSFDILSQKFLEKRNLEYFFADDQLTIEERKKIFDHVVSKLYWYENTSLNCDPLLIDGYNFLDMLDPLYLHQKLLVTLIQFNIIKKIIEFEKPSKIFLTQNLSKIVSAIDGKIELVLLNSEKPNTFDSFDFRITVFSKIFPIKISMKKLKKLQNIFETFVGNLYNLWLNSDDKKPVILLLEFNPSQFSHLFDNLKSSNHNLVILNRRKSALSNSQSIQIMRNSNAKLFNFKNILSVDEKSKIINLEKKLYTNLQNFWKNKQLEKIFTFENTSYWQCIKDFLVNQYEKELSNNVENLIQSRSIFEKFDIKCILYQYESGNFENTTISQRKNIPSLLLRHGFSSYTKKFDELRWRHDQFRLVKLNCTEILLWGTFDYEFYSKFLQNSKKLKVIGSPRHDSFFEFAEQKPKNKKIILITVPPMIEWTGMQDVNLALRYENMLKQLIQNLKKMDNVKIIGKLHPGWGWKFNSVLVKIFNEIDPTIPLYSSKSIKDLILNSDLMININAEDNQPSTVILEGLILRKPIINISLNEKNTDLEYEPTTPFLSLSYKSDILNYVNLALHDSNFKQELSLQITKYLGKYLLNHKNASKELANYLKSFL